MKKILLTLLLFLPSFYSLAQDVDFDTAAAIVKEKGVYEQKRVVTVDEVSAAKLYSRALEALSDWTGVEGRSRAGLDYCDKEEGIVTYKGEFYNGYMQAGRKIQVPYFTDFIMKIRCKDGRAQVTVTIPTMHADLPNGQTKIWTMKEVIEQNINAAQKEDNTKKKKKTEMHGMTTREIVEFLLDEMEAALKDNVDDDF